jgi:dTDP-4-dehydrorhamnose 3,5-epimerase
VFDAIVDLRPDSPTYMRTFSTVLDAETGSALYIPAGCAHGFLTLERDSALLYQMTRPYVADAAIGFAWNDPAFAIRWPHTPRVLSPRDLSWSLMTAQEQLVDLAA